jgi:hemolysin activation/secretion protein
MIRHRFLASTAFFAGLVLSLRADIPDAGGLLRDQSIQQPLPPRLPAAETETTAVPQPAVDSGVKLEVKRFEFQGHADLIAESELQAMAASLLKKEVGITDLQMLVAEITVRLKSKGFFLARAYLPRQDVTGGTVQIAILQAKVDSTVEVKTNDSRLSPHLVRTITESYVPAGRPLNERDLERVLLLLNEFPGVSAKAVLEQGSAPGTTRLVLDIHEDKLFTGSLWADNYGNRYTGAWRGNALLSINDPLRIGDQGTVMISGAEGLLQARASYTRPLGQRGLRGGIAYTAMRYELIDGLKSLEAEGTAHTINTWLSQTLIRRRSFNLGATLGYDFKALRDDMLGFEIRAKNTHNVHLGLSLTAQDRFLGGGLTTASLSGTFGHLDLSGNKANERVDRATAGTSGGFHRINLGASRLQRVAPRLTAFGSYQGQFASGNLDSGEKMSLGGPYGVRAYPVGEASGDDAHLLTLEVRHDLPLEWEVGALQFSAFFDAGHVTLNKEPWPFAVQNATRSNNYWLSGGGLGVSLSKPGRYLLRLNYAHKIGENDGRTYFGKDADGRDSDGRFWLIGQFSL